MTCKEIQNLLPAMIEGVLSEEERKLLETHMVSCMTCRKAMADLRKANDQIKNLEEVEPPTWLKTRIMARVREEAAQKEGLLRKLFYPLYIKVPIQALATVLIAVVAWNVYKAGEPEFRQIVPPPAAMQEIPQAQAPSEPVPAASKKKTDERSVILDKKGFAPPPATGKASEPQGASTVREETRADAEKTVEPMRTAKRAAGPPKEEEALTSTGAVMPREMDRAGQSPANEPKQKAMKAPVGAVAKEAAKSEAAPAASPRMAAAVSPRPELEMILPARDPGAAANEVETILKQISAQTIERQARGEGVILTAMIKTERLEALRNKLKSLGPVQESIYVAPRPGRSLTIRIEIRPE